MTTTKRLDSIPRSATEKFLMGQGLLVSGTKGAPNMDVLLKADKLAEELLRHCTENNLNDFTFERKTGSIAYTAFFRVSK